METKKQIRNDMFRRQEVSFVLEAEKNPNFDECRKLISEKFSKPEENIDVYGVRGSFGSKSFVIKAYVYDSKEDLQKAVQKTGKQREAEKKAEEERKKAEEEAKKAEETPAA
jgi:ribosomal protein S24E